MRKSPDTGRRVDLVTVIDVANHLRWGAYCCLRSATAGVSRSHRRGWRLSAQFVVDAMLESQELRAHVYPFRIVFEARKLLETGALLGKAPYMLAARAELLKAVWILECEDEQAKQAV